MGKPPLSQVTTWMETCPAKVWVYRQRRSLFTLLTAKKDKKNVSVGWSVRGLPLSTTLRTETIYLSLLQCCVNTPNKASSLKLPKTGYAWSNIMVLKAFYMNNIASRREVLSLYRLSYPFDIPSTSLGNIFKAFSTRYLIEGQPEINA